MPRWSIDIDRPSAAFKRSPQRETRPLRSSTGRRAVFGEVGIRGPRMWWLAAAAASRYPQAIATEALGELGCKRLGKWRGGPAHERIGGAAALGQGLTVCHHRKGPRDWPTGARLLQETAPIEPHTSYSPIRSPIKENRVPAAVVRQLEAGLGISKRTSQYQVERGVFSGGSRGRSATYPAQALAQRRAYRKLPRMDPADLRHQLWWVQGVPLGDWTRYRDQLVGVAQGQRDAHRAARRWVRRHRPDLADAAAQWLGSFRDSHRTLPWC